MIDLLHLKNADDEFVTKITKNSSVAEAAEFLQSTWAAAVVMILKRSVAVFVPFFDGGTLDERSVADRTTIVLLFESSISILKR